MKNNIYLISTVHAEKGYCTSVNLFEILNKIKPDVVFCEASLEMLGSFKKGLIQSSLELNAIKKLSQNHTFSIIAIDTYPAPNAYFRNQVNELFSLMEKDKKHIDAWRKNNQNTHMFGFEYLNSSESMKLFDEMAEREKDIISHSANLEYKNTYTQWRNIIDKRENEMLENINFYAENNEFEKAVFLCGSAHRKAIINKLIEKNNIRMNWYLELPT